MKTFVILCFFGWNLVAAAEVSSPAEKEKVLWILPEWPKPASPGSHEALKQEVFQKVVGELQKSLPAYEHHVIRGYFEKAKRLWDEGKMACVAPIVKTKERLTKGEMTAFILVPPYRVIVRNSQVNSVLAKRNSVHLDELLSNKHLKGALISQRSYTEAIDHILEEQKGYRNWTVMETSDWKTILNMVKNERLDYTLEMAEFVRYFNRENPKGGALVALPAKELNSPIVSYVACNKNDWGRAVIKTMDKKLQELAITSEYQKAVETLFLDDGVKAFEESLQDFFRRRAEGSMIN